MLSRNMRLVSSLGITGLCHKAGILLLNAWHVLQFFQLATQIQPAPGSKYPEDEWRIDYESFSGNSKSRRIVFVQFFTCNLYSNPPERMFWYPGSVYAVGLMTWKLSAIIWTCRAVLGNRMWLVPWNPYCLALLCCKERSGDFFKPSMKFIGQQSSW